MAQLRRVETQAAQAKEDAVLRVRAMETKLATAGMKIADLEERLAREQSGKGTEERDRKMATAIIPLDTPVKEKEIL